MTNNIMQLSYVSRICCKTLFLVVFLFVIGNQFNVNEVLVFLCVWGAKPYGVALKFHISYFEIPKHIRETCGCFVCFEHGSLQFVGEFS